MEAHQTEVYAIWCVLKDELSLFRIKVDSDEPVITLKENIKDANKNALAKIDAVQLELYDVEILEFDRMPKDAKAKAIRDKLAEHPGELGARTELSSVFKDGVKKETLIIVKRPESDEERTQEILANPEVLVYVEAVRILTKNLGVYTAKDLWHDSNKTHLHIGVEVEVESSSPFLRPDSPDNPYQIPSFVSKYLNKLNSKRPVSQAQSPTLGSIFQSTWRTIFEDHFEASGDTDLPSIELDTYTAGLRVHHHHLNMIRRRSSAFKYAHMSAHLVDAALTDDPNDSWKYDKKASWGEPLLLQGALADHNALYTFNPRSDFCLFEPIYGPLIMGEVVSDEKRESDRWKMLLEGIAVCRYQNMIRGEKEAVVLCLYLNKDYKMERYLVYQTTEDSGDVHILHDLTLDLAKLENTFYLSKQLFNFRDHLTSTPPIDEARQKRLSEMKIQIKRLFKESISSAAKSAKQAKSQGRRPSQARSSGDLPSIREDAGLQTFFKSIRDLYPVQKAVATAIRRSDMQSVVLKRTRTNSSELHILRLLQSCASSDSNYIIPLLEVVERPPGISILVMPFYTPVLYLSRGLAEELALQLIRGVDWLHKQLISHSDIKETNLVFDEKRDRLFIIDFGLATKLASREQRVRGARGTAEHVAPEVGIESSWESGLEEVFVDEDSIYSPILADVWAVGDVINNFHRRFGSATKSIGVVVEKVAKELRVDDPTERLPLHDAEWQIAAACSTVATVRRPPAASTLTHGSYTPVSTVVTLQA